DRQRGEGHGDAEGHVVALGAGGGGAAVGGGDVVDPHRGLDEPPQLRVVRPALELDAEPVASGAPRSPTRRARPGAWRGRGRRRGPARPRGGGGGARAGPPPPPRGPPPAPRSPAASPSARAARRTPSAAVSSWPPPGPAGIRVWPPAWRSTRVASSGNSSAR